MFYRSFSRRRSGENGSAGRANSYTQAGGHSPIHASRYVSKAVTPTSSEAYTATHSFADFPLDRRLKNNITDCGYTSPTPIQDQAIPHILQGKDVVGIANTGTGKTAAFLVPIVDKVLSDVTQRVIIIVPTRELAVQIADELKAFSHNLPVSFISCIGGSSIGMQIGALRRNPNIVIGTPGRLIDLVWRHSLEIHKFETIVLDEVDRMVDIGFIKNIRFLISLLPRERQSLFFSATVSPNINSIILSFMKSPVTISVKVTETVPTIEQDVIRVKDKAEKMAKLHELLQQEEFKKVLIFGRTKWNVERLARTLADSGFSAASIHGNKSQNQRLYALSQFKQNQLQILVATDIAARGLDIADVSHVINFDEPSTYTDYVHRIGRTGRAHRSGKALTFVG